MGEQNFIVKFVVRELILPRGLWLEPLAYWGNICTLADQFLWDYKLFFSPLSEMDDNDGCPAHYEAGLVEETEHSDEITLKPGHRTNNVLKDVTKLLIQLKVEQNKLFYKLRFLLSDFALRLFSWLHCSILLYKVFKIPLVGQDLSGIISDHWVHCSTLLEALILIQEWMEVERRHTGRISLTFFIAKSDCSHASHTCSKETTKYPAAHKNVQVNQLPSIIWNIVFRETVIHVIVLYLGLDKIEHNVDGRVEAAKHQASDGEYQVVSN